MEKLNKLLSGGTRRLIIGIFCLAAGILFITASGVILNTLVRVAGAAIAICAAARFVYAVRKYDSGAYLSVAIVNSALLFLVGLVMLIVPGGTLRLIFVVIGAYLMINAFTHIYRFALAPKHLKSPAWWAEIITSAVILVLGFWLAFSPAEATRLTEIIAGISLIVKAAELVATAAVEIKKDRESRRSGDVEADFVDKSHEL